MRGVSARVAVAAFGATRPSSTSTLVPHAALPRRLRLPAQRSALHASAASGNGGEGGNGDGSSQHRAAQQQQQRAPKPHRIPNLRGEEFQHPLDAQSTSLLRMLPGLEMVARGVLTPAAEQILTLENIGSSVLVGPQQLPSLHVLLQEAADILGVQVPELYVRQNPIPNAYTLAISGKRPFIVVHTALLDLLTPAEVQAVLAHELGHLKCDHGIWLTAANIIALGFASLLPFVSRMLEESLLRWLRSAELTCDRAALLVAQDPRVVISSLMKLAGGSPALASELSVDAFLAQARSYDEATASPLGWYLRNAQTRGLSHPLPVLRAKEIDAWSRSDTYRALVGRGQGAAALAAQQQSAAA